MEVRLLGPLEVDGETGPLTLGGHRQRAVLARLLLDAGRVVTLDALVEDVWDGAPPGTAVKTLQKYVSELRKVLGGDVLARRGSGYVVHLADGAIDAHRFEALVAAAQRARDRGDLEATASHLARALALWRGEVLADVDDAGWVVPTRTRLGELRLAALEERLDVELALGRSAEVAAELSQLVELHPLREGLWRLSMLALSAAGRPADALRSYERYRRRLADELGLEPSLDLRRLERAVLTGDPSLASTSHSPARRTPAGDASTRPAAHLPAALTSFVGRRELLPSVLATLREARLLTLTGPGGVGKTRLAVEVARQVLPSHPGGAWLVDLATVSDPAVVPRAVADVVGVHEQPGRDVLDGLTAALAHRPPTLLLLDGCEHVLDPSAALADRLLRQCPTLRLLATSRSALGVSGEWLRTVPPLTVTPAGGAPHVARASEGVRLFCDRARLVLPDVELGDEEVATVAAVCRRLDGLPLAIELAASQLRVLSLDELAQRLDDPFGLLRRARRTADRHATLLSTVEWSHELLTEPARAVFARCSVFAGSFGIEAASALCTDVLSGVEVVAALTELVDTSMLVREPPVAGQGRFRLLETLRVFARRQLASSGHLGGVLAAAARFHLGFGRAAGAGLSGPQEAAWLTRLRAEGPNLRSVLAWSRRHDPELAVHLGVALLDYWLTPGAWPEGRTHFCALAEEVPEEAPALRAWALAGAAHVLADAGEARKATEWAAQAVQLFAGLGDPGGENLARLALGSALRGRGWLDPAEAALDAALAGCRRQHQQVLEARCLSLLGTIANLRGDHGTAEAHFRASLDLWTELGGASGRARQWWLMGASAHYRGDAPAALAHCQRAIELFTSVDDLVSVAQVKMVTGDVARSQGDLDRARRIYADVLSELREVGERRSTASSQKNLAVVAFLRGDRAGAAGYYLDSLIARHDLGDDGGVAECLEGLSDVSLAAGRPGPATALLAAAFSLRRRTGVRPPAAEWPGAENRAAGARRLLGAEAFAGHWARGEVLDADEAVELAVRSLYAGP